MPKTLKLIESIWIFYKLYKFLVCEKIHSIILILYSFNTFKHEINCKLIC